MIDQYAEEVKVWKECWIKWEGDEEAVEEQKDAVEVEMKEAEMAKAGDAPERQERKMPGAYEW